MEMMLPMQTIAITITKIGNISAGFEGEGGMIVRHRAIDYNNNDSTEGRRQLQIEHQEEMYKYYELGVEIRQKHATDYMVLYKEAIGYEN